MRALVVLSGGQDSTICLFAAKAEFKEVHAISFDYGQRHARELHAARVVAQLAGVTTHEVLHLGDSVLRGSSPLIDPGRHLEQYESFDQMDKVIGKRVELTFVPMRNALFLALAANRAAAAEIPTVFTGICEADNANYPDCRAEFLAAFQRMTDKALGGPKVKLEAPLIHRSKAQSIKWALTLPGCYAALGFSHTAYDGSYPPSGADHATVLRAHGFEEANIPDPLIVRAYWEGYAHAQGLPKTQNYQDLQSKITEFAPPDQRTDAKAIGLALLRLEDYLRKSR